jgi:hypothetical protein
MDSTLDALVAQYERKTSIGTEKGFVVINNMEAKGFHEGKHFQYNNYRLDEFYDRKGKISGKEKAIVQIIEEINRMTSFGNAIDNIDFLMYDGSTESYSENGTTTKYKTVTRWNKLIFKLVIHGLKTNKLQERYHLYEW